jgi:hypothetical protein
LRFDDWQLFFASADFSSTRIVLNDMSDSGCLDCPPQWGDNSIHTALENDPDLRAAVDVIGVHSGDVEGIPLLPGEWEAWGKAYWQSESNVIDGAMPQVIANLWLPPPPPPLLAFRCCL